MSKTGNNNKKQFKNSTAYKIIVGILLVLYIGYRIWGAVSDKEQETSSNHSEYSEEYYAENVEADAPDGDVESVETSEEAVSMEEVQESADVENIDIESEVQASDSVEPESEESEKSGEYEDAVETEEYEDAAAVSYTFRSKKLWESHYEKHGIDMGFDDKEAYLAAANAVIANPDTLHKIEGEDGDDVYYLEETNEFVVVSTDGYLRTYFLPDAGIDYYNRQ